MRNPEIRNLIGEVRQGIDPGYVAEAVVAHIAGPAGAGKSTLLDKIREKDPNIVVKDLDDFDEEGLKAMGMDPHTAKNDPSWSDEHLTHLHKVRQKMLNKFLDQHKQSKVVLAGYHTEGPTEYKFRAKQKHALDTGSVTSSWRAYKRNRKSEGNSFGLHKLPKQILQARRDYKELENQGYKRSSEGEILSAIGLRESDYLYRKRIGSMLRQHPEYLRSNPGLAFYLTESIWHSGSHLRHALRESDPRKVIRGVHALIQSHIGNDISGIGIVPSKDPQKVRGEFEVKTHGEPQVGKIWVQLSHSLNVERLTVSLSGLRHSIQNPRNAKTSEIERFVSDVVNLIEQVRRSGGSVK